MAHLWVEYKKSYQSEVTPFYNKKNPPIKKSACKVLPAFQLLIQIKNTIPCKVDKDKNNVPSCVKATLPVEVRTHRCLRSQAKWCCCCSGPLHWGPSRCGPSGLEEWSPREWWANLLEESWSRVICGSPAGTFGRRWSWCLVKRRMTWSLMACEYDDGSILTEHSPLLLLLLPKT